MLCCMRRTKQVELKIFLLLYCCEITRVQYFPVKGRKKNFFLKKLLLPWHGALVSLAYGN
uniref:GAP-43 protein n=1 Tax=Rattus norvegicus TaxID=10116 RepID=Q63212_RAT|nr:GAP-43 protein [Rattus norvegicus]